MNIEGINITPGMIAEIKSWQQDPEALRSTLDVLDKSISVIATGSIGCNDNQAREALSIIADLCIIKSKIAIFEGIK